jgi:hypothetical protein
MMVRSVLRDDPDLPRDVRAALLPVPRPAREDGKPGSIIAYTGSEMQIIMTALRHDIRLARDRIRAGHALLARYRCDDRGLSEPDRLAGQILDVFAATGEIVPCQTRL